MLSLIKFQGDYEITRTGALRGFLKSELKCFRMRRVSRTINTVTKLIPNSIILETSEVFMKADTKNAKAALAEEEKSNIEEI